MTSNSQKSCNQCNLIVNCLVDTNRTTAELILNTTDSTLRRLWVLDPLKSWMSRGRYDEEKQLFAENDTFTTEHQFFMMMMMMMMMMIMRISLSLKPRPLCCTSNSSNLQQNSFK